MKVYQRGGIWYIDCSFNGRRIRKPAGTNKKEALLQLAREIQIQMNAETNASAEELNTKLFDDLCDEYLIHSKTHKKPNSYRRDQGMIKNLKSVFSGKPIGTITPYDLEKYKVARIEEVTQSTVNRELTCIKHMFNMAVEWGHLKSNHLRIVRNFRESPGRLRYLTITESEKLIESCADHLRPIVIMALHTGCRKGEILSLTWADVDLENRVLTIRKSKNNEIKIIPINGFLYETLVALPKNGDSQPVFTGSDGKPYVDIKRSFATALKKAGIKNFRFHDLRHTFASHLVMAGVDIRAIQELMGHKDIRMTMRYSHLSDAHLREAVKKLENGTTFVTTDLRNDKRNAKKS